MIYLDTCTAIYLVEEHSQFLARIEEQLLRVDNICISPLVELECLVKPMREKNQALIEKFHIAFSDYSILEINHDVYRLATNLRVDFGLKVSDAVHLACAKHHRCTEFWTNDTRLNQAATMQGIKTLIFQ